MRNSLHFELPQPWINRLRLLKPRLFCTLFQDELLASSILPSRTGKTRNWFAIRLRLIAESERHALRADRSYFGIPVAIHDCAYVATSAVIYTVNIRYEFRDVSVTEADSALSRDAYAWVTYLRLTWPWRAGLHTRAGWACRRTRCCCCCCDRPTIFTQRRRCCSLKFTMPTDPALARHWQWSSLLNVNDDHKLRIN